MFAKVRPECIIHRIYPSAEVTDGLGSISQSFLEIEGKLVHRAVNTYLPFLRRDIKTGSRHHHSTGPKSEESIFIDFDTHIAPNIFEKVISNGYFWFALLCSTSNTKQDSVYWACFGSSPKCSLLQQPKTVS